MSGPEYFDESHPDYPESETISAEQMEISGKIINSKGPTTLESAQAMARAVIPHLYLSTVGNGEFMGISREMSVKILEFLTGEPAPRYVPPEQEEVETIEEPSSKVS